MGLSLLHCCRLRSAPDLVSLSRKCWRRAQLPTLFAAATSTASSFALPADASGAARGLLSDAFSVAITTFRVADSHAASSTRSTSRLLPAPTVAACRWSAYVPRLSSKVHIQHQSRRVSESSSLLHEGHAGSQVYPWHFLMARRVQCER